MRLMEVVVESVWGNDMGRRHNLAYSGGAAASSQDFIEGI